MSVTATEKLGGLWVPPREANRFRDCPEFKGLIDLDVSKVSLALKQVPIRDLALDIGAHIGATAVFLAKHFRSVHAFEAIPATYDYLQRNTQSLTNVETHNIAAAAEEGELYFEFLEIHSQLAHVLSGDSRYYEEQDSRVIGPILARPLDSFAFENVSFIKIDVEGTELDVVRGLQKTILASKPVIMMEQTRNEAKYHGRKENEATDFLLELGMKPLRFPYKKDRLFAF